MTVVCDDEKDMLLMEPVINLTDRRADDDRRLRDHLLAAEHTEDLNPFVDLDWFDVV